MKVLASRTLGHHVRTLHFLILMLAGPAGTAREFVSNRQQSNSVGR